MNLQKAIDKANEEVRTLQRQANQPIVPMTQLVKDLTDYILEHENNDPLLPGTKFANPYAGKKKCCLM